MILNVNNDEELRNKLKNILKDEKIGYKAYNLIRYILATNRSSIRKLDPKNQFELPQNFAQDAFEQYILIS
jgi:hypothetical protein